jgi:hypothetical protein
VQIKQYRSDLQQEMSGKLANVASHVSEKILSFRNLIGMLKANVRTELQHVHTDQANTMKQILERLSTVSRSLLALSLPFCILPYCQCRRWHSKCIKISIQNLPVELARATFYALHVPTCGITDQDLWHM